MDLVGKKFVILSANYSKAYYKLTDEQLSFDEAVRNALALDLTLGTDVLDFPVHLQVLKAKFTPHLRLFSSAIINEVKGVIKRKLHNPTTESSVALLSKDSLLITDPKLLGIEIVSRNTARSLIGPEVYDNPDLLKSFITFHGTIGMSLFTFCFFIVIVIFRVTFTFTFIIIANWFVHRCDHQGQLVVAELCSPFEKPQRFVYCGGQYV